MPWSLWACAQARRSERQAPSVSPVFPPCRGASVDRHRARAGSSGEDAMQRVSMWLAFSVVVGVVVGSAVAQETTGLILGTTTAQE